MDTADMLSGNIMKNILAFASKKVFMPKVIEKVTKKSSTFFLGVNLKLGSLVYFEDLIYCYEDSIKKIEEFLNLGEHIREKQIFDPEKSINNTQLIRLHPEDKNEINKIEKELKEFLYPFEDYKNIEFKGKPFDGAARKAFSQ